MKTTSTLDALMFLTEEPDEHLFINIADAIISYGEKALPSLKDKLQKSNDGLHHQRLETLIDIIERKNIIEKLKTWREKREYDLMEPCFILAKHNFPNVDWSWYGFKIMMIIEQAEREMNQGLTPLQQVKILNHIIYDVNKFRGENFAINNVDYYFINTLLETHIGNPLSLGMLYCIIAERLDIPIYGIDIPNHFLLAFCKKTEHFPQLEDVLFYINPFNRGNVLMNKDIRNYLNELDIQPELKHFEPSKNTIIIKKFFRVLKNLTNS
ncbi:MAG: transglutaminase family protein [Bacteroidales bacterium]|jgi:regulator of sirC expression with transglutaminase-like and TPR domain|nr:transglutaminase family protein [Bacteroidales bacterium]